MTTTSTSGCGCGETAAQLSAVADYEQRRVLVTVLAINAPPFVGEFGSLCDVRRSKVSRLIGRHAPLVPNFTDSIVDHPLQAVSDTERTLLR